MYRDDEILVVKYNGYEKKTLQDRFNKIKSNLICDTIKILDVRSSYEKDSDNNYLMDIVNVLPNLQRVIMSNYKLVDILLDRNIVVDLRDNYNWSSDDELITSIRSVVSEKNHDKLSNNILLTYCSKCNINLFQETPNRCLTATTDWGRRRMLCNRMLCKDCVITCKNHNGVYDVEPSIDENLEKLMYEVSSNYNWFSTNLISKCKNCDDHSEKHLSLDETNTDCECIKTQKVTFKYRLQLLKISLTLLLDNIPSYVVSKVEDFLNNDYSYPDYISPDDQSHIYQKWTTSDVKYCIQVVLKDIKGSFNDNGWYKLSGPVFKLFLDYGEIGGWSDIPDIFHNIWYQNKLYQAKKLIKDVNKIRSLDPYTIESMNLMIEEYQYPPCKCHDKNKK